MNLKLSLLLSLGLIATTAVQSKEINLRVTSYSPNVTIQSKSSGEDVPVGDYILESGNVKYTIDIEPGEYVMTLKDADGNFNGTMDFILTPDDNYLNVYSRRFYPNHLREDGTPWIEGEDYTYNETDFYRLDNKRNRLNSSLKKVWSEVRNRDTYLMHFTNKDTYYGSFVPMGKWEADYNPSSFYGYYAGGWDSEDGKSCPKKVGYTIRVPKDATVVVSTKVGHYKTQPVTEPYKVEEDPEDGDLNVWTYRLPTGTYTYKIHLDGCITHAGKIGVSGESSGSGAGFTLTRDIMSARGTTDYYDHDPSHNERANYNDIYLNINRQGHLRLESGKDFQVEPQRVWQITDDDSNNYYVDPDYHLQALNLDFQADESVISVGEAEKISAKGKGTAIITVDYDALYAFQYNKQDGFYAKGDQPFWYGSQWSKLWAENKGVFVVSVDAPKDENLKPNFLIDKEYANRGEKSLDSEFDTFYYIKGEPGYKYHFNPEGETSVEVANPSVNLENNTVSYSGFSSDNVTRLEDGSYEVLLTYGRNIIRVSGQNGAAEYQVISAKPVSYTVSSVLRPDDTEIYSGEKIRIQYSDLCPVVNKLAGIYNQSSYIVYDGEANGEDLILGYNQYRFAGSPEAQVINKTIADDFSGEFVMTGGCMQIQGYGTGAAGFHRSIDRNVGVPVNMGASVAQEYFCTLPDIRINVRKTECYFVVENMPEDAEFILSDVNGKRIEANEEGRYYAIPGEYSFALSKEGFGFRREKITLEASDHVKVIDCKMEPLCQTNWDGITSEEPVKVTAEEAADENGIFFGMEGYYKVTSGAELVYAMQANANIALANNINLSSAQWPEIFYSAIFEGNNFSIKNVYVSTDLSYNAFILYDDDGIQIRNLNLYGEIKGKNMVAGLVASSYCFTGGTYENIHAYMDIVGTGENAGGLFGEVSGKQTIKNCSFHGTVQGSGFVGGISARDNRETGALAYDGCYVTGKILNGSANDYPLAGFTIYDDAQIKNCYSYLDEASNFINSLGYYIEDNCYALHGLDMENRAKEMTSEQFASGEVCWLLTNNGATFGQTIGVDPYPTTMGDKVFKVTYTVVNANESTGNAEHVLYTNATLPSYIEGQEVKWYSDEALTHPVTEVEADSRLYVKNIYIYTLTYVLNDEIYKQISHREGDAIVPEPAPEMEGYSFSGWQGLPDFMPAHDVAVGGYFTVNSYKLTLYLNNEVYKEEMIEYGMPLNIEDPEVPENHQFDGWIEEIPETMPAHDVDIHGTYSPVSGIGNILIDDNEKVTVWSANGMILFCDRPWSEVKEDLDKGLYIIRAGDAVTKVYVK